MVSTADDLQAACYHEAAHAVFCYHAGYRVGYVSVSTEEHPDRPDRCQHNFPVKPKSSDVLASLLISLAGPYAEFRATRGKSMPHRSYAAFQECAKEDTKDFEEGREEIPSDCMNARAVIRLSVIGAEDPGDVAEKLYTESCRQVAAHVEEFWPEIEAVAAKLSEDGYLTGEEVERIIEGVIR